MEEQIEKFGLGRKEKRHQNKKQRSNNKQQLRNITTSYKDLQEDVEDDWQEEGEEGGEWIRMK
jgi:hypothetical protein|tara:strand:- start:350 stop:538 length:189 start_codon:yes stop_codon:yes gene_type:complete